MAVALRRWCQPNHLHETQGTLRSATTWAMALIAWPKMSHQYPSPFHAYLHFDLSQGRFAAGLRTCT
jgi:hypothetical protein